jgi:hypothetical protein
METIKLTVDSKKRISLTKLLPTGRISSVKAYKEDDRIILEPMVEIPAREVWLYENKVASEKVKKGLSQKGTIKRGSFAKYAKWNHMFELIFTPQADSDLREIENDPSKKDILKAVRKTLGFMETNLRHPSLNTHEFSSLKGPIGEKLFEAYVQQKTPVAYRIFWYYGPDRKQITIVAITPHL